MEDQGNIRYMFLKSMEAYIAELAFHSANLTVKTNVLLCTWISFLSLSSTNSCGSTEL